MITYEQAAKALEIIMNAGNEPPPKAKVLAIDEWDKPVNRKQRRIQASKERRGKNKGMR